MPLCIKCYILSLLVLHPRHKLEYFRTAGWDQSWIDTAKNLVYEQFESRYATSLETNEESAAEASEVTEVDSSSNARSKVSTNVVFPF